jgi:predicted dehydrogenase
MSLRIGFIGAGRMSRTHAMCLAGMEDVTIAAFSDILPERARDLADMYDAAGHTKYQEMLDQDGLDAVYVCTPTGAHADECVAVARRGLPFFVEKPLALTMADAYRVAAAVEEAQVMTCVDYHWRYTKAVDEAFRLLDGRPLATTAAQWLWTIPPVEWLRNRDLGGGQVVDQTTHLTDLCQLFGGPVTEVYAAYTLNTLTDSEFHNWDGYALTWRHGGGAVGSLRSTYALFPQIADFESPRVDLVAKGLFLRIDPAGLTVVSPEGNNHVPNDPGIFHFNANRAFVDALLGHDPAPIRSSVAETLRSLALTLAANESASSGQPVNLDTFMQAHAKS